MRSQQGERRKVQRPRGVFGLRQRVSCFTMRLSMRKILATLAFAAGALLLFFAAAAFAFYHMIQVGELRRFLVGEFEARSGLKLEIGSAGIEGGRVLGVSFYLFGATTTARQ